MNAKACITLARQWPYLDFYLTSAVPDDVASAMDGVLRPIKRGPYH